MKFEKKTVYRAGSIFIVSVVISIAVFLSDRGAGLERNQNGQVVLLREEHGKGNKTEELEAKIGNDCEKIQIDLSEQEYSETEIADVFRDAEQKLEQMILGKNTSLDEVRSDLNLFSSIPDTGISIEWDSDRHQVIDSQGTIFQDDLTEDGTLVKLTAKLKYKEQSEKYELKEAVQKEEEDTRTEKYLILPDEINGTKITWSHEKNSGTVGILIAGGGAAVMVFVSENQKKKEKKKRESEEMRRDYPQIINRFSLYIGAGMSVRNAWQRITEDYRKNKERTGRRKAYEEMIYTENQMKNKAAESECYEEYGIRCGLSVYRRFGTLLSQNLRKGSKGLSELLKRETGEMFEERKKQARKLGEEAGTKLMIPLFMMLAVVFIIVIVPAFFTIQI